MLVECGVHIISKKEDIENFPFFECAYFSWTIKNDKRALFFWTEGVKKITSFIPPYVIQFFSVFKKMIITEEIKVA